MQTSSRWLPPSASSSSLVVLVPCFSFQCNFLIRAFAFLDCQRLGMRAEDKSAQGRINDCLTRPILRDWSIQNPYQLRTRLRSQSFRPVPFRPIPSPPRLAPEFRARPATTRSWDRSSGNYGQLNPSDRAAVTAGSDLWPRCRRHCRLWRWHTGEEVLQ